MNYRSHNVTTPHPLHTVHTISHIHYKDYARYSTAPSNTTIYYQHIAEYEPELPGWEVIDLSLLLYWPAAILNIILMVVIIARPSLRRRPNSPILITICIINIITFIHVYISHFHRYSVPVYLKIKGVCELITVISAVMRVFTPYVYILMAAERLYTLGTSRVMTLPPLRMLYSFVLLGTLFLATLVIALSGILGISGGFYYDYTIDGDYVCFVVFNKAGYYFYTTMLFCIPVLIMLVLEIMLMLVYFHYKLGIMANAPVRMRDTSESTREGSPRDNGYSNEAGSPSYSQGDTNDTPTDSDEVTPIDAVTEEPQEADNHDNLRQMALVAWVSLLVFFLPWFLQLILYYISWYSAHYVGRVAEHILNIYMIFYPLVWLVLDKAIRSSYRGVCCVCLPRNASRDDEERLV